MDILQKSQELDKIIVLYIQGKATKDQVEEVRQLLNNLLKEQ